MSVSNWGKPNPLTVYLGESGEPHDSQRVDILPGGQYKNRKLAVSVDNDGIQIADITGDEQKVLWSIKFCEVNTE
jgi:WD40 repeat protein